jgi:hypothetical protein
LNARLACSARSFVDRSRITSFEAYLRQDLESGAWNAEFGHLRSQPIFEGSLKLIVA